MTNVQTWAYDKRCKLVHAGPSWIGENEPLLQFCRRHEQDWRKWRRQYLADNPDARQSPLGKLRRLATTYVLVWLGSARKEVVRLDRL